MKKTPPAAAPASAEPCDAADEPGYRGWFERFNAGEFYEAHEILEALWLRTTGADRDFFKGLIQVAGAFVHLRKQAELPSSSAQRSHLPPAARLFLRGKMHLAPYGPAHLRLDVATVCALCASLAQRIEASGFADNPWDPAAPPRIALTA